jgi:uncharacterized repeat protein (TIGR01451 family)
MRHAKSIKYPARVTARGLKSAALAALILGLTPLQALAAESCNAAISINGIAGPPTFFEGDKLTLKARIGAGQIRDSARTGEVGGNPYIDFTGIGYGVDCGGKSTMDNLSDCKPVGFGNGGDVGHDIVFEGVTDSDCPTDDPDELAKWPGLESNNIVPIPVLNGVVRQFYDPSLEKGEACNVDVTFTVVDLYEHNGVTETWVTQALGVPFDNYTPGDRGDDMVGTCSNGLGAGDYAKAKFEVQSCGIEVEKQVSLDGETWYDANDEASAPRLGPADGAYYRLVVKNTSTVDYVGDLHVVDAKLGVDAMVSPDFNDEGQMIIGGPGTFLEIAEACAEQLKIGEGFWDNTASVEGTCRAAGEGDVSRVFAVDQDQALIHCLTRDPREASVNIQKSTNGVDADDPAAAPYIRVGDEVTWSYLVTNTGVEGLTIDSVIDDDAAVGDVTASCDKTFLASDEQATCMAKGVASMGLYRNVATVKATSDFTFSRVQDDDPSHYFGMVAAIDLTKTPEPSVYSEVGQIITYTFKVTNLSNVPLTDVTVTDPLPGLYDLTCGASSLAANGSAGDSTNCTAKYAITQADVNAGRVDNTATATGTAPNGDKPTDTANATISTEAFDRLTLVKTAVPLTYSAAGEVIGYRYKLTNSGTRTLFAPYSVYDDRIDGQGSDVDCPAAPASIDPGESVTCTGSYTIVPADIAAESVTNNATGTAKDGDDGDVNSNEDTEIVYYTGVAVLKEIWDEEAEAWVATTGAADAPVQYWTSDAEYRITVENIGAVALENVVVVDANLGVNEVVGNLAVGAKVVLGDGGLISSLVWADACLETKTVTNTATASGIAATSGQSVGSDDTAHLACVGKPDILVLKEVSIDGGNTFFDAPSTDPVLAPVDTEVIYRITVTNTGDVDLVDVTVTDTKISGDPIVIPLLKVGETYTIPLADWPKLDYGTVCPVPGTYTNRADATGKSAEWDADGDSDSDDANVECIGAPSISLVKRVSIDGGMTWFDANSGQPYPTAVVDGTPETALYEITVTNLGEVTLYDLLVDDENLGVADFYVAELGPGQSFVLIASGYGEGDDYELDQLAVPDICSTRGEKPNQALAEGFSEAGEKATASDSATVDCVDEPRIQIIKMVSSDGTNFYPAVSALAPSDAYYRFEVTNIGNVDLKNVVVVDDDLLGPGVEIPVGNLAMGDTVQISHDASGDIEWPALAVDGFCSEEGAYPNIATASGDSTESDDSTSDTDSAMYECNVPEIICSMETGGSKPNMLYMMYDGTVEGINNQGDAPIIDTLVSPLPSPNAKIRSYHKGIMYLDEVVAVGGQFEIGGWHNDGRIAPNIYIEIWNEDATVLHQKITFHGSCSAPLVVGDSFGGVTIVGYKRN